MQKFWELFEQSIITQAVITALLVMTICAMYLMGKPIPTDLIELTMIVVGFWFGSKIGYKQGAANVAAKVGARASDASD